MKLFTLLRYVAYMRRGVLALERIALAMDKTAQIAQLRWDRAHVPRPRKITTEFGTMDERAVAEKWQKDREAEGLGEEDES